MKVILSEKEKYELEMPAEISLEDFKILVKKLNVVVSFAEGKNTSAKQISQAKKPAVLTREDRVNIIKGSLGMKPNTPEMDELLKKYNVTYNTVYAMKWRWIDSYNITAQELGLEVLPERKTGKPSAQSD